MKKSAFKKIVVIGLGLMGGSLAAAARRKFPAAQIVGVARRKKTIRFALKRKWIHTGSSDLKSSLRGADLAVICLPVDLIPKTLTEIERNAQTPLCVTDVGSVKKSISDFYSARKWKKVRFVGAHPMVGSHERGIEAALSDLYQKGLTVVTPSRDRLAQKKVENFWKSLCRKTIVLNAAEHDRRVALISHLPHLLSVCLAAAVDQSSVVISSTGFRDMTRLAKGDKSVWAPIFVENKKEVLKAIKAFQSKLDQFKASLISSDESKLVRILEEAYLN